MTLKLDKTYSFESESDMELYEGPFGDCEDSDDKKKPERDKVEYRIPGLKGVSRNPNDIDTINEALAKALHPNNIHTVSEDDVNMFVDRVNTLSKEIANVLLKGEAEYTLALESASSYVQAFLRDCLNIEAFVDEDVQQAISSIGKANIVFHALKRMPLPPIYKAHFYKTFMENLAINASNSISEIKKPKQSKERDLEVVLKRYSDQPAKQSKSVDPGRVSGQPPIKKSDLGTKKSRTS